MSMFDDNKAPTAASKEKAAKDKAAKDKAAKDKAAKDKAAKAKDKGPTIGAVVRAAMKLGKTNEQCLEAVKAEFPDCKTTLQSVSWYRNDMRQKGEKVLTAKEAKIKQEKIAAKEAAA